jgi:hypothetical protein
MRSIVCDLRTIGGVGNTIAKVKHLIAKLRVAFVASGFGVGGTVTLLTVTTAMESFVSPIVTFFGFIVRFSGVIASFESCRAHVMQTFRDGGYREEGQKSNNK